jgi:hypothetical protein
LTLACGVALLSACQRSDTPIIFETFDADRQSVSADAKQRMVFSVKRGEPGSQRQLLCAEPSPDTVSATAVQTAAALAAKLPGTAAGVQVSTEAQLAYQRSIAESVAYIGVRNSTIQLLRDGLYRACEAYMNGAIGDFGYALVLANYGRLMVALLTAEGLTQPGYNGPIAVSAFIPPATVSAKPGEATVTPAAGGQANADTSPAAGAPGSGAATEVATIMERVVKSLADPNATPDRAVLDMVVACAMWREDSPMRSPRGRTVVMQRMCDTILLHVPATMEAVLEENGLEVPPIAPSAEVAAAAAVSN